MHVWIDLVNSPHIPFFLPVIQRLEKSGHSVIITYRDFAQTAPLVKANNISATLVGGHGGKSKLGKIKNLCKRTIDLYHFAKNKNIDLAISHNSYFQIVAARLLNIPCITSMDFEGQPANHLAFRLASFVSVPEVFPKNKLKKFGAKNIGFYQGLKEDICLNGFTKNPNYISKIQIAFNLNKQDMINPIVLVRPPPSLALYHNNDESLFDLFLSKLSNEKVTVLVLPRVEEQKQAIALKYPNFNFSNQVLDGLQLISHVDLVVSGGGSMNREAACLNVHALSFFSGQLPCVDKLLQKNGLLSVIHTKEQIDALVFNKKKHIKVEHNKQAIIDFMSHISNFLVEEKA